MVVVVARLKHEVETEVGWDLYQDHQTALHVLGVALGV